VRERPGKTIREEVGSIMNKTRRDQLQGIADNVCKHFQMGNIIVQFSNSFTRRAGDYDYSTKIIRIKCGPASFVQIHTLLHELAHHLHRNRFDKRVVGYYKMEMWPSMVLDSVDKTGKKWYAAKGKKKPVYFTQKSHGKAFEQCLDDIWAYYVDTKTRRR